MPIVKMVMRWQDSQLVSFVTPATRIYGAMCDDDMFHLLCFTAFITHHACPLWLA